MLTYNQTTLSSDLANLTPGTLMEEVGLRRTQQVRLLMACADTADDRNRVMQEALDQVGLPTEVVSCPLPAHKPLWAAGNLLVRTSEYRPIKTENSCSSRSSTWMPRCSSCPSS